MSNFLISKSLNLLDETNIIQKEKSNMQSCMVFQLLTENHIKIIITGIVKMQKYLPTSKFDK